MNENGSAFRVFSAIVLSVVIALLLTVLPLPDWAIWFRPRWVALVVIFWSLVLPYRFGVGSAWLIGLILDFIQGTLIGEQALVMCLISYAVIKFHLRMQLFTTTQRILVIFVLVLFYQLMLFIVQSFMLGRIQFSWFYWITPFISALIWPWVYSILKACQRRFKIFDPAVRGLTFGRE